LKAHKKPSLDRAVDICARIGASEIMSFKHDWNTEIVAQFYATLYVDSDRVMHWMTAGEYFSVEYAVFAGYLGFDEEDHARDKIHDEIVTPP